MSGLAKYLWHGGSSDDESGTGGHPAVELLGERYRLIEQLGSGGMSVVWRGYDEVLGRQVAIKVLASRLASDRAFRARIRAEAKAAARLCHPHITGVYDYGEAVQGGLTVPYVVMELIDGESLHSLLRREGALPWRNAVATCAEVAAALAAAHARGVVHRDVTPGNVMLTATGVKVVDFGISALTGDREAGPDGTLLGTPAYLAPERLDGGTVSPATDVYALGLLLYKSLSGRSPWQASTTTEMLRAHLYAEPTPLPPVDGLPAEVAALCRRCLAKDPTGRPTSAEVAQTLFAALGAPALVPVSPAPVAADSDGPEQLAEAGTTILPSGDTTDAVPAWVTAGRNGRRPPAHRRGSDRRAVEVAAVGVGLLAVTGLVWSTSGSADADNGSTPTLRPGMALQAPPDCAVDYALRRDNGRDFAAELTVRNTADQPRSSWQLRFALPADQVVTKVDGAGWEQRGRQVVLRPAGEGAPLAAGAKLTVQIAGRYAEANPLPVEFRLDAASCQVRLIGATSPPTTGAKGQEPAGRTPQSGSERTGGVSGGGGSGGGAKAKPGTPGKGKAKADKPGGGGKKASSGDQSGDGHDD